MAIKKTDGMTLLEVLVAVAIFSVGCMALFRTAGQQIQGLSTLEEKTIASWVADKQLAQLYISGTRPASLWQSGKTSMADRDWYWRYRSLQTTDQKIYAVDVEISDEENFEKVIFQLRTWMKS